MNRYLHTILICIVCTTAACGIFKKKTTDADHVVSDDLKDLYYNAETAYLNGNFTDATQLFTTFTKESPNPAPAYYRLACIELASGKYKEALEYTAKARLADDTVAQYRLYDAEIYKSARMYGQAGRVYAAEAVKVKSGWTLFGDAAKMFLYANLWDELLETCNQWELKFGIKEEIINYRVTALTNQNRLAEATTEWRKLITKYPERRKYRFELAELLIKKGDLHGARLLYDSLLLEEPENPEIISQMCNLYQKDADVASLWKYANRIASMPAISLEKKHACFLTLMNSSINNRYFDSLEPLLLSLSTTHPNEQKSWYFLADWYYSKQRWLKAAGAYNRTLKLLATDFHIWSKYTECLDRLHNWRQLASAADTMVEYFPVNPSAYLIQAKGYMGLKQWAKGIEACENGLAYAGDMTDRRNLNTSLARILNYSGQTDASIKLLKSMLIENVDDFETMNLLASVYAENNIELAEATIINEKALKSNPTSATFNDTKGLIQMAAGEYDEAEKWFQKALQLDADYTPALEHMGDYHHKKGNAAQAAIFWKKALEKGQISPTLQTKINQSK